MLPPVCVAPLVNTPVPLSPERDPAPAAQSSTSPSSATVTIIQQKPMPPVFMSLSNMTDTTSPAYAARCNGRQAQVTALPATPEFNSALSGALFPITRLTHWCFHIKFYFTCRVDGRTQLPCLRCCEIFGLRLHPTSICARRGTVRWLRVRVARGSPYCTKCILCHAK